MTTMAELLTWKPHRLSTIADTVTTHRRRLVDLQSDLDSGRPPASWVGADQVAATTEHTRLYDGLVDDVAQITVVIQALDVAATELAAAKSDLQDAIHTARGWGLSVDTATGKVTDPGPGAGGVIATAIDQGMLLSAVGMMNDALTKAATAEQSLAEALGRATTGDVDVAGDLGSATSVPTLPPPSDHPVKDVEYYSVSGTVGAAVQGKVTGFIKVEHLPDGTVRLTYISASGAGVAAGVGVEATAMWGDKRYGASLAASAEANLLTGDGEVYTVDGKDGDRALEALLVKSGTQIVSSSNGTIPGLKQVMGFVGDAAAHTLMHLPDPDATIQQVKLDGAAGADFTYLFGGASAGVDTSDTVSVMHHHDGAVTATYAQAIHGGAQAHLGAAHDLAEAKAEAEAQGEISVKADATGHPVSASVKLVYGAQADAHGSHTAPTDAADQPNNSYREETLTLPLSSPGDQRALQHLVQTGDASQVAQAVRDHGTLTRRDYDLDSNTYGGALAGEVIAKVGGSASFTHQVQDTTSAQYWDGQHWVDWK